MSDEKGVMVDKASLIARGLITESDSGCELTKKGRRVAQEILSSVGREMTMVIVLVVREIIEEAK